MHRGIGGGDVVDGTRPHNVLAGLGSHDVRHLKLVGVLHGELKLTLVERALIDEHALALLVHRLQVGEVPSVGHGRAHHPDIVYIDAAHADGHILKVGRDGVEAVLAHVERLGASIARLVIDEGVGVALGTIERRVGIAVGRELEVAGIEEAGPRVAIVHAGIHLHRVGETAAGRVGRAADKQLVSGLVVGGDGKRQRAGLGQLVDGCLGLHGDEPHLERGRRACHTVPAGEHAVELRRGERVRPHVGGETDGVGGVGVRPVNAHLEVIDHIARQVGGRVPCERHGRLLRLVGGQRDGGVRRTLELHDILRPGEREGVVVGVAGREARNRQQEEEDM